MLKKFRIMKIRKVTIPDYKVFRNFEIDFTHEGQVLNLVVIAGENGSVKTTLLSSLIEEVGDVQKENPLVQIDWEGKESGRFHYYPVADLPLTHARMVLMRFIDQLIYQKDMKSSEALAYTQELLETIFQGFHLNVRLGGVETTREVFFLGSRGEHISIDDLSRGEQQMISKAFSLYLSDIHDSVILIDEPEASLHPSWQSRIALVFQKFADTYNNQIILSTHSPHIVSAVRREQVRVLLREDEEVRVISDFSGSYGWRIDKVLLEIMGAHYLRVPEVEEELDALNEMVDSDRYDCAEFRERMQRLEDILGYSERDLMLLRLEVEQRCSEKGL